jgi:hypothetical protein
MSIQSLNRLPYDNKIEIVLFLDLQSLHSVAQLDKTFYTAANDRQIWKSQMDRMKMLVDSEALHPKIIMINQIHSRITAFLALGACYPSFSPQTLVCGKPMLLGYKKILEWFEQNPTAIEKIGTDNVELDETHFDSLIDTQAHADALLHKSDES